MAKNARGTWARAGAAALAAVVLTWAGPSTASAHDGLDQGEWGYQGSGSGDVLRAAAENGYESGFHHGSGDRASGAGFNYRHDSEYQQASYGYDRSWGDRMLGAYQDAFRRSYVRGYQDGFAGRGREGGWGARDRHGPEVTMSKAELAQIAQRNGYFAGVDRGHLDSARGGRRSSPQADPAYRRALDGWNSEWGWSSVYQYYFRAAFLRGYRDGLAHRYDDRRY
jgi:ribosome modulation factor